LPTQESTPFNGRELKELIEASRQSTCDGLSFGVPVMISLKTMKLALVLGALLAGLASANSIGLNFVDNGNGGVQNGAADALAALETAGAPSYLQAGWNNLGRWGQSVAVTDSVGAATGVTVTWDSNNTWRTGSGTANPQNKLMHGYLDATGQTNVDGPPYQFFWNENKPEVYVTGLSAWLAGHPGIAQYHVVVYTDGDTTEGRIGEYWLQAGSSGDPPTLLGSDLSPHVFARDSANFAGLYTQVPLTANSVANAADGNYIVFTGLSADSFILRTEEQTFRAQINGLQIFPGTPVELHDGDVDGDGDVDFDDFAAIRDHFRMNVNSRSLGDLNADGFVDFVDFGEWTDNYPFNPGSGAGAASANESVPEPSCLLVALAGLLGVCSPRRFHCLRQRYIRRQ
jgi:hypothetical protein